MASVYVAAEIDPAELDDGGAYAPIPGNDVEGVSLYRDLPSAYSEAAEVPSAYSEPGPGDDENGSYTDNGSSYGTSGDAGGYGYNATEPNSYTQNENESSSYSNGSYGSNKPVDAGPTGANNNMAVLNSEFSFVKPSQQQQQVRTLEDDLFKQKNWNREFQQLLSQPDSEEKYVSLSRLANEFVFVAETYGKVIISELSVPAEEKTVKPVSIGGIAGGEKYIVQGILFKFALDISGIYAGDENAMKAAGHELIGLSNFYFSGVDGLHFPLMCLIRYCGFCLVAMSILPIGKDTLMYGSSDGGRTVHFDDPSLTTRMEQAGRKMNLKPHFVGTNLTTRIYGPGDIEGHRGYDGKCYVVDFARVFPPEAALPGDPKEPGRILYKLLRPEIVSRGVPLSSDALTGWGKIDPDAKIHNAEVVEATKYLLLEAIPSFVGRFVKGDIDANILITMSMKQVGINVRHLGLIRNLLNAEISDRLKEQTFLTEIFARVLKSMVQERWRKTVRSHFHINQEKCKEQALHLLNDFLDFESECAVQFWCTEGKHRILSKFKGALVGQELAATFDPRRILYISSIVNTVRRFQDLTGFRLTHSAMADFKNSVPLAAEPQHKLFMFLRCDAKSIEPTVKHTNIVDFADVQALLMGGVQQSNAQASNRYFDLALTKLKQSPHMVLMGAEKILHFATALSAKAKASTTSESQGPLVSLVDHLTTVAEALPKEIRVQILLRASKLLRNLKDRNYLMNARSKLASALELAPQNHKVLFETMKVMAAQFEDVTEIARQLIELHPHDPKLNLFLGNQQLGIIPFQYELEKREQVLAKALGFYSLAVQMDPSMANKAQFLLKQWAQEAQLRIAASCPAYRPPLRAFYSEQKRLVLLQPSDSAGDSVLVAVSYDTVSLETVKLLQCSCLTDSALELFLNNIKATAQTVVLRSVPGAGPLTAAALLNCTKLKSAKLSFTSIPAASALDLTAALPLEVLHVDGTPDFSDDCVAELSISQSAPFLRSLGLGKTAITSECVISLQKFDLLKKLYLRQTQMSWSTCQSILIALPKLAIFSVEKAPEMTDSDVITSAFFLEHPSLELLVLPSENELLFSGGAPVKVSLASMDITSAVNVHRSTEKRDHFKRVLNAIPPSASVAMIPSRLLGLHLQRGKQTLLHLSETAGFGNTKKYALALTALGRQIDLVTFELTSMTRMLVYTITGQSTVRTPPIPSASLNVSMDIAKVGSVRFSNQGWWLNVPAQRCVTFGALMCLCIQSILKRM